MHLQKRARNKDGKKYEYWELVESYRTARGPRRRSIAYLGVVGPGERLGVKLAAEDQTGNAQGSLFDDAEPEWVEVDTKRVRVERTRQFGGAWLGLELMKLLGLPEFLRHMGDGSWHDQRGKHRLLARRRSPVYPRDAKE
jgi:hypothetical protein